MDPLDSVHAEASQEDHEENHRHEQQDAGVGAQGENLEESDGERAQHRRRLSTRHGQLDVE